MWTFQVRIFRTLAPNMLTIIYYLLGYGIITDCLHATVQGFLNFLGHEPLFVNLFFLRPQSYIKFSEDNTNPLINNTISRLSITLTISLQWMKLLFTAQILSLLNAIYDKQTRK